MLFRFIAILGLAFLSVSAYAADPALKTQKDKVSYSIGLDIGKNLKTQGIEIDPNLLSKGIQDAVSGGKPMLTEEEVQGVMTAFSQEMQSKMAAKSKAAADKNQKEGDAFLAENKKMKDVVTLQRGLQYKLLKAGTG